MTCKEALTDIIRAEGFDFVTACGMADDCMAETLAAGKRMRWTIGRTEFYLSPKGAA